MAYDIELVSLHCRDAQEGTDEAVLNVNGQTIWGPGKMGTNDTKTIRRRARFYEDVTVELWEEDPYAGRRNDLRIGAPLKLSEAQVRALLRGDHEQLTHDFNWTRTREIDAKYRLTYSFYEVSDKSEGSWD